MTDSINLQPELNYPGLSILGRNVFNLKGKPVPMLSGEVQFFRMDPSAWEPALREVKALGLPMVATYLSWRRFSTGPGQYDLTGVTNPRLDLPAFLALCRKYDLWLTLKPGPWICAEETNGGYPDWLVKDPDVQVLDAENKAVAGYMGPFTSPIPSYLHPSYQSAVSGWLAAVDAVVRDQVYPNGPIVLVQLDNEPCYTFHDRMFESDYNPANLAFYRVWLAKKYSSLETLNAAHRSEYASFEAVDAPRRLDLTALAELPRFLDWAEFKEWVLARHVASIGEKHLANGVAGALFTINLNEHPQLAAPNNWKKLERVSGLAGYDYYPVMPMQFPDFVKVTQAVNYSTKVLKANWSPEIMCGIWSFEGSEHGPNHLASEDFRYLYFTCLAYGLKGMNFYMLADRDNWVNSPITDQGARAEAARAVEDVVRFFDNVPAFPGMGREQPVGVLAYRPYARQAFAAGSERVRVEGMPLAEADAVFYQAYTALLKDNLDPCVCDLESNPESLDGVRLLVVPGGVWMDRATQIRLRGWAEAGGQIVWVGQPPSLDEQFRPVETSWVGGKVGTGRVTCFELEDLLPGLETLLAEADLLPLVRPDVEGVLSTLQAGGGVELLFVINTRADPQAVTLTFRCLDSVHLVDVENDHEALRIQNGAAQVALPGRSVRVYRLIR